MIEISFAQALDSYRWKEVIRSISLAITDYALSDHDIKEYFLNTGKQLDRAIIIYCDIDRILLSLDPDATPSSEPDISIRTWDISGDWSKKGGLLHVNWTFHCLGSADPLPGTCSQERIDGSHDFLALDWYYGLDNPEYASPENLRKAVLGGIGRLKDSDSIEMHYQRATRWYTMWFRAICDNTEFLEVDKPDREIRILTFVKNCYEELTENSKLKSLDHETILDYIKHYVESQSRQGLFDYPSNNDDDLEKRERFIRFLHGYPKEVLFWLTRSGVLPGSYEELAGLSGVVHIADGITRIEDKAFYDCIHLTDLYIPDSVSEIGVGAFDGCVNLTSVHLPMNLKLISARAFARCRSLEKISIPDSVKDIGNHAFSECGMLSEIHFPKSLKRIGVGAFDGCVRLSSADLPSSIKEIPAFAFARCKSLRSVIIPRKVSKVGDYAFSNCSKLMEIRLPDGLTEIGTWAFSECSCLNGINIPGNLSGIGAGAFFGCSKIKEIHIPDSVNKINVATFMNCTKLKMVSIPDNVKEIRKDAFEGCINLKTKNCNG